VEHDEDRQKNRIKLEQLQFDSLTLYRYEKGEAHLYRNDGSEGPTFPFDWSRSAIPTIPARRDNKRLTWFRERLDRIYTLSPAPLEMRAVTEREVPRPDGHLLDFVSWLRFLSNDLGFAPRLIDALKPVLDGFVNMQWKPQSETAKELMFGFTFGEEDSQRPKAVFWVPFDRLSDGQRCIAALYAGLFAVEHEDATLCLDEPDNYVALREIQPWLVALEDLVEREGKQGLVISHHPELINSFACEHGVTVYREAGGPARLKPFGEHVDDGVSPAEIVARGWEA
jgi:predicted ATPase